MRTAVFVRHTIIVVWMGATFLALGLYTVSAHDHDTMVEAHDHLHHSHFAQFAKVPEKARRRPNPLASDPDAIVAGKKLFARHCSECHGNTGEGSNRAPNLHAEEVQSATPGTLFWILSNGVVRKGMPVWSKLPEPERWQIVAYLATLKKSNSLR